MHQIIPRLKPPALVDASIPSDEETLSSEPANNNELPLFSEPEVIPELSQTQDISTTTAEAEEIHLLRF